MDTFDPCTAPTHLVVTDEVSGPFTLRTTTHGEPVPPAPAYIVITRTAGPTLGVRYPDAATAEAAVDSDFIDELCERDVEDCIITETVDPALRGGPLGFVEVTPPSDGAL